MRIFYWSNSKFADWLRIRLGLPKQPSCATLEGWDEFHAKEKAANAFGVKIIDSLNSIQSVVYFIPDVFSKFLNFANNVKHRSHVLKTRVKFGNYSDLTNKISDALMLSIIEFVESECFYSSIRWYSETPSTWPESVIKFHESGKLARFFNLVKVSDTTRAAMGFEYIKFQMEHSDDVSVYLDIIDAYRFAKYRYLTFDSAKESGFNDYVAIAGSKSLMQIDDNERKFFDVMSQLEDEFEKETTRHCLAIVKWRYWLWT